SVSSTLTKREVELLREAAPDHLRVELRPGDLTDNLKSAVAACNLLGTRLEVALFLREDPAVDLKDLEAALRGAPVERFLVFQEGSKCSDGTLVQAARVCLARTHSRARFLGGTNLYFAELNGTRPEPRQREGRVFTIT